jgi:hypothetical protein
VFFLAVKQAEALNAAVALGVKQVEDTVIDRPTAKVVGVSYATNDGIRLSRLLKSLSNIFSVATFMGKGHIRQGVVALVVKPVQVVATSNRLIAKTTDER